MTYDINQPGDIASGKAADTAEQTILSAKEFLNFGLDQVAYVKPKPNAAGDIMFGIYAADGTELTVLEQFDNAVAVIKDHDLTPLSVH